MSNHSYSDKYRSISDIKVRLLLGKLESESEFSRSLYDAAIANTTLILKDLYSILYCEYSLEFAMGNKDSTERDKENAAENLDFAIGRYDWYWLGDKPTALLDDSYTHSHDDVYFSLADCKWHSCESGFPYQVTIPSSRLDGLDNIISELCELTGITFSIERVFYSAPEYQKYLEETDELEIINSSCSTSLTM